MDDDNKVLYSPKALCLTLQTKIHIGEIKPYALSNIHDENSTDCEFNFAPHSDAFGTDNCTTHHICSDLRLFVKTTYREVEKLGVQGISGSAIAEGIGTIKFMITDNSGKKHEITLDNVIHLPEASKNLISIAQWSKDKNDDCGIFSRGERSLFMWGNDSKTRLIHHNPTCCITLLPINKGDNNFNNFLRTHSDDLVDNVCLLQDGCTFKTTRKELPTRTNNS